MIAEIVVGEVDEIEITEFVIKLILHDLVLYDHSVE